MLYLNRFFIILVLSIFSLSAYSQQSKSSGIKRSTERVSTGVSNRTEASQRIQERNQQRNADDSELAWMKVIYRQLDLTKAPNAALYFPEDGIDGDYNLFRLMLSLLIQNKIAAYEYLDGREIYSDANRLNVKDMLDRFQIDYVESKGYSEKNPVFAIEADAMPSSEILSYYIIERWELDRRDTRMHKRIEAICPVLHRSEEFGYEPVRYPLFWMKYDDLRPYLAEKLIFTDDDNNVPTSTYDDYFTLGLYDGEIYKTRNLRNKSMIELYPDPDERKRAQDSIDNRLASLEKNIWVEDPLKVVEENDSIEQPNKGEKINRRGSILRSSNKKANKRVTSNRSSGATKSVRSRKN